MWITGLSGAEPPGTGALCGPTVTPSEPRLTGWPPTVTESTEMLGLPADAMPALDTVTCRVTSIAATTMEEAPLPSVRVPVCECTVTVSDPSGLSTVCASDSAPAQLQLIPPAS